MTAGEKLKLFVQAQDAGFDSVADYLRSRVFGPQDPELDTLVALVRESTQHAADAVDRVLDTVNRSRDKAIRDAAKEEWESWTPEQKASLRALFLGDEKQEA